MLQEGVHADDRAGVSGLVSRGYEVASAGGRREVVLGVHAVERDHEVAVLHVDVGGLRRLPALEELGQHVALDAVDALEVEPGGRGRDAARPDHQRLALLLAVFEAGRVPSARVWQRLAVPVLFHDAGFGVDLDFYAVVRVAAFRADRFDVHVRISTRL